MRELEESVNDRSCEDIRKKKSLPGTGFAAERGLELELEPELRVRREEQVQQVQGMLLLRLAVALPQGEREYPDRCISEQLRYRKRGTQTVIRYSTARSGLLKLARKARRT